eukprot:CAMPEP_0118966148 /NCGR_PEP_ID=MMETSP1173-20130426/3648_1 /TAXON_ID=1034831 /ORGANISM="Rhizochromulina marina cf, Strain CCMP1243" /LENGTH=64 /DNA_ID=CAMNT_0006914883 /DNA_START=294 /DNA_END=484 /DNA_ORIENTATION=+
MGHGLLIREAWAPKGLGADPQNAQDQHHTVETGDAGSSRPVAATQVHGRWILKRCGVWCEEHFS